MLSEKYTPTLIKWYREIAASYYYNFYTNLPFLQFCVHFGCIPFF